MVWKGPRAKKVGRVFDGHCKAGKTGNGRLRPKEVTCPIKL